MADDDDPSVSWRDYVESRFEQQDKAVAAALASQERAVAAALAAADRAVLKAETASEKRFDAVNEFRAALADNFRTLMPRSESEQAIRALTEKLDILTTRVNAKDDRGQGRGDVWGFIVGAGGLLAAIISIIFALTRQS